MKTTSTHERKKDDARLLAAPHRLRRFLLDLANLRDDRNGARRFIAKWGGLLPELWQRVQRAAVFMPQAHSAGLFEGSQDDIAEGVLREWARGVRNVWASADDRTRSYRAMALVWRYGWPMEGSDQDLLSRLEGQLPKPGFFERAVNYLAIHGARARICINPDCPARYFFAKRRSQVYCSQACATPVVRLRKREWWRRYGPAWRNRRLDRQRRMGKVRRKR